MIEVFKTDVTDRGHADILLRQIHRTFTCYTANFDIQDCDRILRVNSTAGSIQSGSIIRLLKEFGCTAEVLPDEPPLAYHTLLWERLPVVH